MDGRTMNFSKTILALIMIASPCSGALVQKSIVCSTSTTTSAPTGIDVSKNKTIDFFIDCPEATGFSIGLPCDSSDLYCSRGAFWDDFDDGCGGQQMGLQSRETIRELKNVSAVDFSRPLSITDTALFPLVTIVGCPYFVNPYSTANWPDVSYKWAPPPLIWYLSKTKEGNYYLFRFIDRQPYYGATCATISYILQTDGSLNFKGAGIVAVNSVNRAGPSQSAMAAPRQRRFGAPSLIRPGEKLFDVRGRMFQAPPGGPRGTDRTAMIYFIVKGNGSYFHTR
jgi:hypothetical protein